MHFAHLFAFGSKLAFKKLLTEQKLANKSLTARDVAILEQKNGNHNQNKIIIYKIQITTFIDDCYR